MLGTQFGPDIDLCCQKDFGLYYVPLFIYQGIKKYHNKYFEKPSVYGTLNYHTGVKEWESLEELIYDS